MRVITGILMAFDGQMGSGIAHIVVQDDRGVSHSIPCENAPTMRALLSIYDDGLAEAFGSARVTCTVDFLGLLSSIQPEEED